MSSHYGTLAKWFVFVFVTTDCSVRFASGQLQVQDVSDESIDSSNDITIDSEDCEDSEENAAEFGDENLKEAALRELRACGMYLCGSALCYVTLGSCCLNVNYSGRLDRFEANEFEFWQFECYVGDSQKANKNEDKPPHSHGIVMTFSAMIRAEDSSIAKHIELKIPFSVQQSRLEFVQWLRGRKKLSEETVVDGERRFQLEIVLDLDREDFEGEEKQLVSQITESTSARTTFTEATALVFAVVEYRNDLFLGNQIDDARKREYYQASDLEQLSDSIPDEKLNVLRFATSTATSSSVPSEAVNAEKDQDNTANLPEPKLIREALPVLLGLEGHGKSSNRELRGPGILKNWGALGGWFEMLGYEENWVEVHGEEDGIVKPSWKRVFADDTFCAGSQDPVSEWQCAQEGIAREPWVIGVLEGMFGFLRNCLNELEYSTISEGLLYALGFGRPTPNSAKLHNKTYLFLQRSAQLVQGQEEWALKVCMDFLVFSQALAVYGHVKFESGDTRPLYKVSVAEELQDDMVEVEALLRDRKIGNFRDLPEQKVQKLREDVVQEWKNRWRRKRGEEIMVDAGGITALRDSEELRHITQKILQELKNIQSEQEQQKQIKKLMFKWHPDKNNTENATKVFQWLNNVKDAVNKGVRFS